MRRLARNSLAAFFVAVVMDRASFSLTIVPHGCRRSSSGHCRRAGRALRTVRGLVGDAYDSVVSLSRQLRIAMVSMHTSPLDAPGSGDAGGMNVVERHTAEALAALGHQVDLITRRSDPRQPDVVDLGGGVRVRHLDAGP